MTLYSPNQFIKKLSTTINEKSVKSNLRTEHHTQKFQVKTQATQRLTEDCNYFL